MNPLRVLLPDGRLLEPVIGLLAKAGLTFVHDSRVYRPRSQNDAVVAKIVKARMIPSILAQGSHDIGFSGLDWYADNQTTGVQGVVDCIDLGFGRAKLVVAAPPSNLYMINQFSQHPYRVATKYVYLTQQWAGKRGLLIHPFNPGGCVEAYPPDDADFIVDISQSGKTLESNGLAVAEVIMDTTTHLLASQQALADGRAHWLIEAICRSMS